MNLLSRCPFIIGVGLVLFMYRVDLAGRRRVKLHLLPCKVREFDFPQSNTPSFFKRKPLYVRQYILFYDFTTPCHDIQP